MNQLKIHQRDIPLLGFLSECNKQQLTKKVLDCGAGGSFPPLSLFYNQGYETYGIELSDEQIEKAKIYAKEHDIQLKIIKGDMRELPYEDSSFSFVYSHYSLFYHMSKQDIQIAIGEMERVLRPSGLLYFNIQSFDDITINEGGRKVGDGEIYQKQKRNIVNGSQEVLYTFFTDDEADNYLVDCEIVYKEKKLILISKQWGEKRVILHYIAKKKGSQK